jgi:hypothetical protein
MKKTCLMALLASAFIASLAAQASAQASETFTVGQNEALVIMNQLGLYTESGGNLTLKEGLVIGDRLTIQSPVRKFKIDKTDKEFIKVKAPSGVEGWVRAPYALAKVSLAVVQADAATVYSQPRDVSVTAKTISNMTVVAVFQDGSNAQWCKVNCYDAAQNVYYTEADNVFVPREELSFADADLNAVIIYTTAAASKNKDIRANLLKVIEKKYSSTMFLEKIRAALAPAAAGSASKPTVAASGRYLVNDDNVNVRAAPDEVGGAVVGKLGKGAEVEVVEATAQSYAIAGLNAPWYRIKEPAGWVYGSFLNAKP